MCGIIGYIGKRQARPVLIKGLRCMEYRGYDSAGIALVIRGRRHSQHHDPFSSPEFVLHVVKTKGNISKLEQKLSTMGTPPPTGEIVENNDENDDGQTDELDGTTGIGHTRWATHGVPNQTNSHPHLSKSGRLALVHNGIVENHETLRVYVESKGYICQSETDSEVLVQLLECILDDKMEEGDCGGLITLQEAVRLVVQKVVGAYAVAIVSSDEPDVIVVAKRSSPLVIGIPEPSGGTIVETEGLSKATELSLLSLEYEFIVASDEITLAQQCRKVVYLEDDQIAILHRHRGLQVLEADQRSVVPTIRRIDSNKSFDLVQLDKGGYDHYMRKEIDEQPNALRECMAGRLVVDPLRQLLNFGGMGEKYLVDLAKATRIIVVGCGTSWHAGLVAEYLFEDLARLSVEVEYASEFRYRNPIIREDDVVVVLSQSGETADSLAALHLAKSEGATTIGICNVVGSSIARAVDSGLYTHAGPEIGVASTKSFTAQVVVLLMLALETARRRQTITNSRFRHLLFELIDLPTKMAAMLDKKNTHYLLDRRTKDLAVQFESATNFLFLGRGINFPTALEGALKMKEISYIHAEGYPAAEMKHGPIALVDKHLPVLFIAPNSKYQSKIINNIQEVKARGGIVVVVVSEGDGDSFRNLADHVIEIPLSDELLSPIYASIPLQLLSYHIAIIRGCHVDQPRNLAKSVTVE